MSSTDLSTAEQFSIYQIEQSPFMTHYKLLICHLKEINMTQLMVIYNSFRGKNVN